MLAATTSAGAATAGQWLADSVGDGYEYRYIDQGRDYSGPVRATVVRKTAGRAATSGILYVHGYNDYFFQTEMGDVMVSNGLAFYAVDLRKYGRSLMPGQRRYEVKDLKEYFADIDSALNIMSSDGVESIVMIGHSTGGLITSYYLSTHDDSRVKGLILNSPFLDWNLGKMTEKILVPTVGAVAAVVPGINIPQGNSTAYAESLLASHHGRWRYDTAKKLMVSPPVTPAWIKAIDEAQWQLSHGPWIDVPILLMHSDNSVTGDRWTEAFNHGDAVLDVADIAKFGRALGPSVTEATVKGGLHDLVLSEPDVAAAVYDTMLRFIGRLGLLPNR